MSRPSFLRIGDVAVNVDQILMVQQLTPDSLTIWFGIECDANGQVEPSNYIDLPITLDQFEEILRASGREVATVDGAS